MARIVAHAGPWVTVLTVNAVVLAGAELALPAVLGATIDSILQTGTETVAGGGPPWLAVLALLIALLVAGDALDDLAVGGATARSTSRLRHAAMWHVLSVGLRGVRRLSAGELTARLVGNTAEAGSVAPDVIRGAAALIPAVGGTIALALIDPWLCVTFLVGLPVMMALLWAFARDASELAEGYLTIQGKIAGRLVQALSGARTIAAAGTAERETKRVLGPLATLHDYGMRMWRAQARITAQDLLLLSGLEIAVLAVGGWQLSRGRISPGELLAASQYVALGAALSSVIPDLTRFIRSRAAARRVGEVLDLSAVGYGNAVLPSAGGTVEFRKVSVRVGERVILDRLNLVIPAGSLVAVVGRTGAGKSLLAGLAGRLVDPDDGVVLLDGVQLIQLTQRELRGAVGYGFERPVLIGGTLAEAISFGAETPDADEVMSAARAARADAFIRHLPAGYQTPLDEAPMSGGEMQRMGLARAFAHTGRVLILDDVAASLDTVTEHEISRALTGAMADRTRILVAHRASTAARADQVIWLDEGRVRAQAAHRELWADPDYRGLFEAGRPEPDDVPVLVTLGSDSAAAR
ncbi:MAG: ABC transporter ATP-binding protein/permease [Actinomycetota bacterium]|nr:ABC transporter ATP-binding protein/permease [Actinomycetota bacterium]